MCRSAIITNKIERTGLHLTEEVSAQQQNNQTKVQTDQETTEIDEWSMERSKLIYEIIKSRIWEVSNGDRGIK